MRRSLCSSTVVLHEYQISVRPDINITVSTCEQEERQKEISELLSATLCRRSYLRLLAGPFGKQYFVIEKFQRHLQIMLRGLEEAIRARPDDMDLLKTRMLAGNHLQRGCVFCQNHHYLDSFLWISWLFAAGFGDKLGECARKRPIVIDFGRIHTKNIGMHELGSEEANFKFNGLDT